MVRVGMIIIPPPRPNSDPTSPAISAATNMPRVRVGSIVRAYGKECGYKGWVSHGWRALGARHGHYDRLRLNIGSGGWLAHDGTRRRDNLRHQRARSGFSIYRGARDGLSEPGLE